MPPIKLFSQMRSMRAASVLLSASVCFAAMITCTHAEVLARVNGEEITDADLKTAREELGPTLPPQFQGNRIDAYVLSYLIDGKLVAKKAEQDKIDQTADFKRRLEFYRQKALLEAEMETINKAAVTDAAIQKSYDEIAKSQKPVEEVHARHILVATEDEAKAVYARLKKGEDFAKVAIEVSKDPGSPGGDLGFFTKDRMVPEFAEVAFALKPGDISQPVKTQFGWHIIEVEEVRQQPFPSLDSLRNQVARYVGQKAEAEEIMKLRKAAKIERTAAAPKDVEEEGTDAETPASDDTKPAPPK